MEPEELKTITDYISAWGWQMTAIAFFCVCLIMFSLPRTRITEAMFIGTFLVFVGCEYWALKRKNEVGKVSLNKEEACLPKEQV